MPMRRVAVIDRVAAGGVIGLGIGVVAAGVAGREVILILPLWLASLIGAAHWRFWGSLACCIAMGWGCVDRITTGGHLQSACSDGITATFVGRVTGLPQRGGGASRFDFDVERGSSIGNCAEPAPRRLRLSWYAGAAVRPGERWALEVRLRSLRSYINPGGFDYVAWARSKGIDVGGTVRRGLQLETGRVPRTDAWRDDISRWIDQLGLAHAGLLRALAVGDARDVGSPTWERFRTTGTIHLLVISGLHIGIAAGFGLVLGRGLSRAFPGHLRRVGDHRVAATAGAVTAIVYSLIAGFTLPVARACLMTLCGIAWWMSGRRLPPHRALLLAVLVLVGCDPGALADDSLWLSVGAVGVLLAYFAYRRGLPWSSGWIRAQWLLVTAMVPILLATVGQFAWIAPVANLVAVPLVSFVLVPFVLGALLFLQLQPSVAATLLGAADHAASILLRWLRLFGDGGVSYVAEPDPICLALAAVAAVGVLLPWRPRSRFWLVPVIGCIFLEGVPAVPWGEVQVRVLDVGQGLAVVVDSATHRLLYDTGPAYPSGFDLGEAVVVPALRATGAPRVDLLILSHGDLDHRGGHGAVARSTTVESMLSGIPGEGVACRRGQTWQWDGVVYRILHPIEARHTDNDGSCVLAIEARGGRALLPGDISASIEQDLAARDLGLRSDLIVAPHHGSRTSSSPALVAAVAPALVAISAGYRNRFGHPHSIVVDRYRAVGAQLETTAEAGALTWLSDDARRFRTSENSSGRASPTQMNRDDE